MSRGWARDRMILTGFGAGVGLAGALAWWLLWGCRACVANSEPWSAFGFSAFVGVVLANAWGMEHLERRRGHR